MKQVTVNRNGKPVKSKFKRKKMNRKILHKQIEELEVNVKATNRIIFAILHQIGGEVTITAENLEYAHKITGGFETDLKEDGSFWIKRTIGVNKVK